MGCRGHMLAGPQGKNPEAPRAASSASGRRILKYAVSALFGLFEFGNSRRVVGGVDLPRRPTAVEARQLCLAAIVSCFVGKLAFLLRSCNHAQNI